MATPNLRFRAAAGGLYKYFIKFAELSKPKYILIENVIGIKSRANDIIKKLDEIGYLSDFRVLQAQDFGVPQNRKRLFFFAIKKEKIKQKVNLTNNNTKTEWY